MKQLCKVHLVSDANVIWKVVALCDGQMLESQILEFKNLFCGLQFCILWGNIWISERLCVSSARLGAVRRSAKAERDLGSLCPSRWSLAGSGGICGAKLLDLALRVNLGLMGRGSRWGHWVPNKFPLAKVGGGTHVQHSLLQCHVMGFEAPWLCRTPEVDPITLVLLQLSSDQLQFIFHF